MSAPDDADAASREALAQRLRAIEERLARLEARLPRPVEAPARQPEPAPPPLPPPPQRVEAPPPPPRAEPPPPQRDLERFVGLAVLGRVGAAAVLLAAAYFGQLGWTELGPAARVVVVHASGLLMVAAGALLRPRVAARYVAILWGSGTALSYLGGVLAGMHYELLPPLPATAMLLGSAALGQVLGRALGLEAFATVALGGAYAAPVLVGAPQPTPTSFFALLLLLHAWASWTQWRWSWHVARGLAAAATAALAAGWYLQNGVVSTPSFLAHVEALAIGLTLPELLLAFRGGPVGTARWMPCLACWWVSQLTLLLHTWAAGRQGTFGLAAGAAMLAAGALLARRSRSLGGGFARIGSVLVAFGALVAARQADWLPDQDVAEAWACVGAVTAAALLLLALRPLVVVGESGAAIAAVLAASVALDVHEPTAQSRMQAVLALAGPAALVAFARPALASAFALALGAAVAFFGSSRDQDFGSEDAQWLAVAFAASAGWAVFGAVRAAFRPDRLLMGTSVALLGLLGALWSLVAVAGVRESAGEGLRVVWNVRFLSSLLLLVALAAALRAVWGAGAAPRIVLSSSLLAVAYVAGLLEVQSGVRDLATGWSRVAASLYTLLFAGGLLVAGFRWRQAALRWTGLAGFLIVAVKVTAFDLANVGTPLRILAAGAVGLVLLLGAFGYARTRRAQQ